LQRLRHGLLVPVGEKDAPVGRGQHPRLSPPPLSPPGGPAPPAPAPPRPAPGQTDLLAPVSNPWLRPRSRLLPIS
jgi:hypothetical protein